MDHGSGNSELKRRIAQANTRAGNGTVVCCLRVGVVKSEVSSRIAIGTCIISDLVPEIQTNPHRMIAHDVREIGFDDCERVFG